MPPTGSARHAARLLLRLAADRETVGRHAERLLDQAKKVQDILGEHQDTVVIQGYLHEAMDRTEPGPALAQSRVRGPRERRKKARAAFFGEWPPLERRGCTAWSQ